MRQKRTLLVLSGDKTYQSTRRLLDEGRRAGCLVRYADPMKVRVVIGDQAGVYSGSRILPCPQYVLARVGTLMTECSIAAARFWELNGARVVNRPQALAWAKNKMYQLLELHAAGLPVPFSLLSRDEDELLRNIRRADGPPVVLKTLQGTQGKGVILAESAGAAASMIQILWGLERNVLVQAWRRSDHPSDIRIIMVGGTVVAAMRRWAQPGEFRSNVHQGSRAESVTPDRGLQRLACRAARVLGLEVAGVDVIETAAGWEILEVNASPGIAEIERVTGVNVAGAIIHWVTRNP